jgi:hypothetical protein
MSMRSHGRPLEAVGHDCAEEKKKPKRRKNQREEKGASPLKPH